MKQKTIVHCLKALLFVGILVAFLGGLSHVLEPKDNTEEAGICYPYSSGYLGEADDTLDVLFLGDSLVYSGVQPMTVYEQHGISGYDISISAVRLYQAYDMLSRFFHTQSPKVVMLEADTFYRDGNLDEALVIEAGRYIPFIQYHDRWKELTMEDWTDPVHYTNTKDEKGYRRSKSVRPASDLTAYMTPDDSREEIDAMYRFYLRRIKRLCENQGAELVLFSVPSVQCWTMAKHNAVADLAEQYGLTYLDLNLETEQLGIDWSKDTRDEGDHLNYYGAKKVSNRLGQWLTEQFDLPDRRGSLPTWDEQ